MKKYNAKEFLPLVQALADGKVLQFKMSDGSWRDYAENTEFSFIANPASYRIKPEPREWKSVVIKDTPKNRQIGLTIGGLVAYDDGDEQLSAYEVIRVREILD